MNYVSVSYFLEKPKTTAVHTYDYPCDILQSFFAAFSPYRQIKLFHQHEIRENHVFDYADEAAISRVKEYSSFAQLNNTMDMAKSVSIPIALSELKRASLQRLSTRRSKKKEKPLNGFVMFVQERGDSIKLFGSVSKLDSYDVGDEIVAVNDVQVDGKSRDELLMHIKDSIENRTIQLKVKRVLTEGTIKEETYQTPHVTDAYVVCVDKGDVKKICSQLKQKFHDIRTFDMEEIACSKLNNITPAANNMKQTPNGFNNRATPERASSVKQKENEFLRNSIRSSKKLKSLSKETKEASDNVESTSSYDNECYEQPKDASTESIPLKKVIVSVERITDHLSRIEGREEDRQLIMNYFQQPSIQDAIEQAAQQHESVDNHFSFAHGSVAHSTDVNLRVVSLFKREDTFLGATVRNEENRIVIGRVVKGGLADKMGLLHEGDELVEMNGMDLRGKRVDEVCDMLRHTVGHIRFVVSPSKVQQKDDALKHIIHLRALFDYDPEEDVYVPCRELALKFERGDILHVLNTTDENWWQAYRDGEDIHLQLAGLIPSSSFHQQVVLYNEEVERENRPKMRKDHKKIIPEVIRTLRRRSSAEIMRSADEPPIMSCPSQMLTYEEVQLHLARTGHRRPLVLCGPEGVGCLQLRQRLLQSDSNRLASPIPYTSRQPRDGEINGVHYHFVSKQYFQDLAKAGKFVEFGEYQKNWYGTSVEDISTVIHKGMTCILTLKPESISGIRIASVMPYVVFIAPPSLHQLRRQREYAGHHDVRDEQLKPILASGKQIEQAFGHYFDSIIVNTDIERTQEELRQILKMLDTQPFWVPADWIPPTTNGTSKSH